jgi:hypothetical protein
MSDNPVEALVDGGRRDREAAIVEARLAIVAALRDLGWEVEESDDPVPALALSDPRSATFKFGHGALTLHFGASRWVRS